MYIPLFLALLIPSIIALPQACSDPTRDDRPQNAAAKIRLPSTLADLLSAISVMQSSYFELWTGTWPTSIDWTAAVLGTHISSTLSTFVASFDYSSASCSELFQWENTIEKYFTHTTAFYFGENAFSLRNQAYDDMLWVVLGWLESIKFQDLYTRTRWSSSSTSSFESSWHGTELSPAAAHRTRIFYEIASHGWDTSLCSGGMVWNPRLTPYKNAITNELYISASIAMYLYYPGDKISSPFLASSSPAFSKLSESYPDLSTGLNATRPHDKAYLNAALDGYKWLKNSGMTDAIGLYQDGFHITNWRRTPNGTTDPGTGICDELNTMLYTYNQGVILSGLRGLYLATKEKGYLDDGHSLIESVILATGWGRPKRGKWAGLGRDGVLEEWCDHQGACSQNGQTFKGIFFMHLHEFCLNLRPGEKDLILGDEEREEGGKWDWAVWRHHRRMCARYGEWVLWNAQAALRTKDEEGRFGTWWGRDGEETEEDVYEDVGLPPGAVDYRNVQVNWDDVESERLDNHQPPSYGERMAWTTTPQQQQPLQYQHPHSYPTPHQQGDLIDTPSRRKDPNSRGRGRTVETQSGGVGVLGAAWMWERDFRPGGSDGYS